jgi:hypothetical protein
VTLDAGLEQHRNPARNRHRLEILFGVVGLVARKAALMV